ncbi:MAG: phosphoglycerate dehydrogenase [Gemmatimonadales bacterium]
MNHKYRVLIADKITPEGLAPLEDDDRFELERRIGLDQEALADALVDFDAVLVRSTTKISAEALAKTERLKVIGRAGVGVDTIDVAAATKKGIPVLNAPAGNTTSAAELTFALLMALARRIPAADRSMKAGEWNRSQLAGTELSGKTLGLVGAGRVGGEVARRARAFDMRVLVYDPYLTDEQAERLGITRVELDEALSQADFVSIHVPLTDSTRGLIGPRELSLMKPGAMLVNAARGEVVDEAALVDALIQNHLGGAALDVYATEPLPQDHPLRQLDNIILTPHLGASTGEAQRSVALEIAEGVRDALLEGDLSRAVNAPSIGGAEMQRLRPLLDLTTKLGRVARTLAGGPIQRVELRYAGDRENVLRPLSAAAMIGLLADVVGRQAVNFVNALHLANERGLKLERTRTDRMEAYGEYIEITVSGSDTEFKVAGAMLGEEHPRIVRLGDYYVDVVPSGCLVILRNQDVPGVVGKVGTLLGEAGVNIAEYHQARHERGGEALAAIRVDQPLDESLIDQLAAAPEIVEVSQVDLRE